MADVKTLARELYEWLKEEPTAKAAMVAHRKALLTGGMEGQSGTIVSASGNGVSFTQTAGMDAISVARAIRIAIRWNDNGTTGGSRSVAFFG